MFHVLLAFGIAAERLTCAHETDPKDTCNARIVSRSSRGRFMEVGYPDRGFSVVWLGIAGFLVD